MILPRSMVAVRPKASIYCLSTQPRTSECVAPIYLSTHGMSLPRDGSWNAMSRYFRILLHVLVPTPTPNSSFVVSFVKLLRLQTSPTYLNACNDGYVVQPPPPTSMAFGVGSRNGFRKFPGLHVTETSLADHFYALLAPIESRHPQIPEPARLLLALLHNCIPQAYDLATLGRFIAKSSVPLNTW